VRRDELARLGIQLPVLPVIVLGGLPGAPDWALRLERVGLDVVSSGAAADTVETWRAARDAVPHRPTKAVAGDAEALIAAGCLIVESDEPVDRGYALGAADTYIEAIDETSDEIEEPDDVSARLVVALQSIEPAAAWVAASGMAGLTADVAEAKLAALMEGARRARLYLAKRQFEL
jgi:hypothetical protein